uniref:Uncharacterized protein n=1 Tax=Octopus bimaculoides TaxID=37653 RepID=A0A0L8HPQ5_OCTBM
MRREEGGERKVRIRRDEKRKGERLREGAQGRRESKERQKIKERSSEIWGGKKKDSKSHRGRKNGDFSIAERK